MADSLKKAQNLKKKKIKNNSKVIGINFELMNYAENAHDYNITLIQAAG